MKKISFILTLCALILFVSTSFSQTKSILFLGNSYTYYNGGLPTMLKNIANSLGETIEVESNAPGGYTLENHSTNATSLELIASRDWDYVVLQEQSQKPSFPPAQVETEVYPYATVLCDSIYSNNTCTKPLFFMTWGYENGDASNCPYYPPLCTYSGMQWRLRQSYVEMAEANDAWAVPCGMAVKAVRESNPEIELYYTDGSHPSIHGTYLAACTFYSSIYHKSAAGAYIPTEITADEAAILQNAAWTVVCDSLDIWRIDTTTVRADFEPVFLTKSVTAYLMNYSENSDSCLWIFGDGTQQMQYISLDNNYQMMTHEYPAEAEYEICLIAYKGCDEDMVCKTRYIFISGLSGESEKSFTIFPNPVKDGVINIENAGKSVYRIFNSEGKVVLKSENNDNRINISGLKAGNYILQCKNKSTKFVIE